MTNNTDERLLLHNEVFLKGVLVKYIIPSVFAMLSLFLGAIIDNILIGIFLGEDGLSAMSLVSPLYLFYYTIGATIGIGGSLAANHYIGKREYSKYKSIFSCALILMILVSILSTAVGLVLIEVVVGLLNGNSEYYNLIKDYVFYYILGGGFTLMSYIPLYFLRSEGKPKASFSIFLTFSSLNIVLTALFLSPVFSMSTGGAALATSISMAFATLLGFIILFKNKGQTQYVRDSLKLSHIKEIIVAGVPNGLANLLEATRNIFINFVLLSTPYLFLLPTFTVVRNVLELLSAIMLGISTSILSLISIFNSEHDNKSIHKIFRNAMKIGVITTVIISVIVIVLSDKIAMIFGVNDIEVINSVKTAIPLICTGMVFSYINIQYTGYFNSIKRPILSNIILSLRLVVFITISIYPLISTTGVNGIWLSFATSELLTTITFFVIVKIIRSKHSELDNILLNCKYLNEGDISFSVKNKIEDIMFASNKISEFCEEHDIDPKRTMRTGLVIEEILQIIIAKSLNETKECFIDIRIKKIDDLIMFRIRNSGKIFNIIEYYNDNKDNEELMEELLGLRLVLSTAKTAEYTTTFGVNNLMIIY